MSFLYNIFVYKPLYNGLMFLFDSFPWINAGFAVIVFTIIVRLILFPLSKKATITQLRMKEIEPELNKIKNTITDKQQQAVKVMALYKEKGVNPFSSFFLLFLQLPIIFALYSIFIRSGLPEVKTELLYSFIKSPTINMSFLWIENIAVASTVLAVIAGISQYIQLKYSFATNSNTNGSTGDAAADIAQNMMKNMKYVLPVMIFFFAKTSAVIAIYLIIASLFTLGQELVVRKHLKEHKPL